GEGLEGDRGSVCPWDPPEQPPAEPLAGSPQPGAEVCPRGAGGVPAFRGALLRQEAIAPREEVGVPRGWETPAGALGKGGSQPEPPSPGGPARSRSGEGTLASARAAVCPWEVAGGDGEVCPGDAGKSDNGKISKGNKGISPQRASLGGTGETAPAGDMGSGWRGPPSPGEGAEEPGVGLAAKPPKASSEAAGTIQSRKATVCPWEEEDAPAAKTEICPWEEAAAPPGKERAAQDTQGTSKGENKPGA
ncbi:GP179 protein, partial [Pterocles burchelli]|nr:GP179 protein [Pterocles burchelli]